MLKIFYFNIFQLIKKSSSGYGIVFRTMRHGEKHNVNKIWVGLEFCVLKRWNFALVGYLSERLVFGQIIEGFF